jgi:hypothetical protein
MKIQLKFRHLSYYGCVKKPFIFILALVASSLLTQSLWASSLRCGERLILRNDHISKIERYCGEPETYISSTAYKTVSRYDRFYRTYFYEEIPIVLEEMVFNFGPNKFMRLVKLENGIVKKVETLGYGFRD